MRNQLSRIITVSAACLALSAQAQTSADRSTGNPGGTTADPSTGQSTRQPGYDSSKHAGAMSRMGNQEVRASKIIGVEVRNLQGQNVGTINDVILNPASGRIDFAVLSLSPSDSQGSTTTATTAPPTPDTTSSSAASSAGKLVAVPWMLLRSSGLASGLSATTSATAASTSVGQPTFTFAGDTSKLQSALTFDQSNWPDITQFAWRQSIYSHFGMTPGSATGGATSPGGTESSSGASSRPSTSVPVPGTTSPDSSSPPAKPPQ